MAYLLETKVYRLVKSDFPCKIIISQDVIFKKNENENTRQLKVEKVERFDHH